jgi:hypothetical protein
MAKVTYLKIGNRNNQSLLPLRDIINVTMFYVNATTQLFYPTLDTYLTLRNLAF